LIDRPDYGIAKPGFPQRAETDLYVLVLHDRHANLESIIGDQRTVRHDSVGDEDIAQFAPVMGE